MPTSAASDLSCPVCGRQNQSDALFCVGCIAPLQIPRLSDLTPSELSQSFDDLLDTVVRGRLAERPSLDDREAVLLRSYLSAFWLRPETALLQFVEARIVAPLLSESEGPFLDLGCGDGIHASLLHGWRFGASFDAYQDVDLVGVDIFNAAPAPLDVVIDARGRPIDFGVDVKPSVLERARQLGSFERLLHADAVALPLPDGSVGCIYSNVIRDFDETLDDVLRECARVLRPAGKLLLVSPTEHYQKTLYYVARARARADAEPDLAAADLRLDRGRSVFCRQQVPTADWEQRLQAAGLRLRSATDFAGTPLMRFWDTGFRPFSPLLIACASALRGNEGFDTFKEGVVSALVGALSPLLASGPPEETMGFRLLVATCEE